MSRGYAFGIQCSGIDEWFWEWNSFSDRSAYWLHLGPFEFAFSAVGRRSDGELMPFTRAVAFAALKRWAQPALDRASLPLRLAGATAMGVAAVAIALLAYRRGPSINRPEDLESPGPAWGEVQWKVFETKSDLVNETLTYRHSSGFED